eukprot:371307-Rhodomonas_salina.1
MEQAETCVHMSVCVCVNTYQHFLLHGLEYAFDLLIWYPLIRPRQHRLPTRGSNPTSKYQHAPYTAQTADISA